MDEELEDVGEIDIDELIKRSTEGVSGSNVDPAHEDRMIDGIVAEQRRTAEQANAQNQSQVRKIKVKKLVKKPVSAPVELNEAPVSFDIEQEPDAPSISQSVDNNFDLDSYLDGGNEIEANLPAVNNPVEEIEEPSPRFINENDLIETKNGFRAFIEGEDIPRKTALVALGVVFFVGFFIAKLFFTEQKVVQHGLQGVVTNPEVPRGRARCGLAEKTQGCVLYIMNPQRQDLNARDFYDLASQLTGRQRFVIETGNMRYSGIKIRPGEMAQLNIPPLQ